MTKDIEVEVSGPLSNKKNAELIKFLEKNGKKTTVKHRVLIDYSTFLGDGIKNRKKDIRLRITNGQPEIIVKLGDWNSSNHRKELSVFTEAGTDQDSLVPGIFYLVKINNSVVFAYVNYIYSHRLYYPLLIALK